MADDFTNPLPEPPVPGTIPPLFVASAHAAVQAGAITLGPMPFNIAAATYVAKGVFKFDFIAPLNDANYTAFISCGAAAELADGQRPDTFTINTYVGGGGAAHDPKYIDFQIWRVQV
jgi:hypothetical protein